MRKLIILTVFATTIIVAKSQHELGISLGTAHLLGDFGGGVGNGTIFIKDIDLRATKPALGLFYRYNFAKILAIRGQLLYGGLYGNDLYSAEQSRFNRGLNSSTAVYDLSAQLEFNFIPLQFCAGNIRFTPYVAGGVALAKTNPSIASSNQEGVAAEEVQYIDETGSGIAFNIPISAGVKLKTKKNLVLGMEASYRMAFTDKLDSYVRQQNDQFFFVNANLSYVFCKNNGFGKMSKQMRCPTYN